MTYTFSFELSAAGTTPGLTIAGRKVRIITDTGGTPTTALEIDDNQKAMIEGDTEIAGSTTLNIDSGDKDFTVKKNTSGDAIIYDAGDDTTSIGDGGTTNYTQFAADGTLTLYGDAIVEKYMTIGAAGLIRGTAPPGEGIIGTFPVLLFASNITESAYYAFHVPADRAVGTNIKIAIYWCPTTNDAGKTVTWEIDWEARAKGDGAAGEILGTGSTNVPIADVTYAGANNLQETPYAIITGSDVVADDTIGICVSRDHDDGDDYGTDAALVHIEIEYYADKLGG